MFGVRSDLCYSGTSCTILSAYSILVVKDELPKLLSVRQLGTALDAQQFSALIA